MNTFQLNCGPEGAGDGRFHWTASGEWLPDGGALAVFQGYEENGLLRSLNGRLIGVHACKGRQKISTRDMTVVYMIPVHSKIGSGKTLHFEKNR